MDVYRMIRKGLIDEGIDFDTLTNDFIDDISYTMTLNTEIGEIRKQLESKKKDYSFMDNNLINAIIDTKDNFKIKSNNKWHRFSLKLMKELIPDMEKRPVEQMNLIMEKNLDHNFDETFLEQKYLPYKKIAENIYNPVTAKSVREGLKIVNAIIKKYGHINYVVVEMPRDKNDAEQKKQLKEFQRRNKKEKEEAIDEFCSKFSNSKSVKEKVTHDWHLTLKVRLWYQQDGLDVYLGKAIQPSDLLINPLNFEIDHIIPQSVSEDDGINNKTLCYANMNQAKKKTTPWEFLNKGYGQGFDKMKSMVKKILV
nr:type II CRISPR RNA-guided endonuclease Cas9 [Companilactobacillus furfuricola]